MNDKEVGRNEGLRLVRFFFKRSDMSAVFRFLQAPYPINSSYKVVLRRSISVSVFVAFFLLVFQPFGLSSLQADYKSLYILSYGIPCFLSIYLIGFLLVWIFLKYDLEKIWKVKHEILVTMLFPIFVGAANALHSCLIFQWEFSFEGLLRLEIYTIAVSFFPVVGLIALDWITLLKRHEKTASLLSFSSLNDAPAKDDTLLREVTLMGENQNEDLTLSLDDIVYIKAEGNYVELIRLDSGDFTSVSVLLRSSLRSIEDQLSVFRHDIVRCHRSYLVNQAHVFQAKGNAQGLTLSFKHTKSEIPVSRKYVSDFRSR